MSLHVENVEHGDYQRCPACRAEFVLGRGQHRSDCPILSAITHLTALQARCAALEEERENMCVFITRLCRHSYKLGVKNKLTDSAMDYINKTDAVNTPTTKLLRKLAARNAKEATP